MKEKLKLHDGDTPGKVIEVKLEYPKKDGKMSELICPFCNKKLEPIGTSGQFQCGTWGCDASFNFIATRDVWEYIERTRKALDLAKERLKNTILDAEILATPEYLASRAKETLDEITALEQKDK